MDIPHRHIEVDGSVIAIAHIVTIDFKPGAEPAEARVELVNGSVRKFRGQTAEDLRKFFAPQQPAK